MMGKALSGELSCMLIGLVTKYYNIVFCMRFSYVIRRFFDKPVIWFSSSFLKNVVKPL